MAKTQDEIKELLSTNLFKKGIANNYITINNDNSYITVSYTHLDVYKRQSCYPHDSNNQM